MLPDDEEGEVMVGRRSGLRDGPVLILHATVPVIRWHPIFGIPSADPASFTRPFIPPDSRVTPIPHLTCLFSHISTMLQQVLQPALIEELPRSGSAQQCPRPNQ